MTESIHAKGGLINYTLNKRRNSRTIRISIKRDGAVVVSAPLFLSRKNIEDFVLKKSEWILGNVAKIKKNPFYKTSNSKNDYPKYKDTALQLAVNRLNHFNKFYNFKWNKISIKNTSTRWGSCSKKGNLNFNYKIALLAPGLADYIIVHELCHLGQFNHSQLFWNLVGKTIPNYKILRARIASLRI